MASKEEILSEWRGISSRELAAISRRTIEDRDSDETASGAFYYRGGREEFEIGAEYCRSADPLDRCTGAFLLEHLGYDNGNLPFAAESIAVILPLLDDEDERVIQAGVWALGRIGENSMVHQILRFDAHPNEDIRYSATFALSAMTDAGPEVTESLLRLAKDPDRDIRDWATFALGSQSEEDSTEIRQILFEALSDEDGEIRGEGYAGLAAREDSRAVEWVLRTFHDSTLEVHSLEEWRERFDPQANMIEAMIEFPDHRLVPFLEKLQQSLGDDFLPWFREDIEKALQVCGEAPEGATTFPRRESML